MTNKTFYFEVKVKGVGGSGITVEAKNKKEAYKKIKTKLIEIK